MGKKGETSVEPKPIRSTFTNFFRFHIKLRQEPAEFSAKRRKSS